MGGYPTQALAELIVELGANVQPGQIVAISSEPGKEELTRALAEAAYRRGAKFVDLSVFDVHLKRARALYAAEESLEYVPPWYGERVLALGEHRAARIALTGPVAPGIMDGVDPARLGRDSLPFIRESGVVVNARTTNWTVAPGPTAAWAGLVHPELGPEPALDLLWQQIAHICRLDEPDPAAAWAERLDALVSSAEKLTQRGLDALRFSGPGTELTIGLLPSSRWTCGRFETVEGLTHIPNLPTEEVFTTPDPRRVDGHVTSTRPLVVGGSIVRRLQVWFSGGRVTRIEASEGAELMRSLTARDEGAARLGEVALVDRAGRIGALDTVFYDTLLDENAASHIALGNGYAFALGSEDDVAQMNSSAIHVDFMIGSSEVTVTGLDRAGGEVPVLRGGDWQL